MMFRKYPYVTLLVILSVALFFTGCGSTKEAGTQEPEQETSLILVEHNVVESFQLYGAGDEGFEAGVVAIRSEKEFKKLIEQMSLVNDVSRRFAHVKCDFKHEMLIACFDEVRPNGGHKLDVKLVTESEENIEVHLEHTEPQGVITTVVIQPYQVIQLEKSNKPVITR